MGKRGFERQPAEVAKQKGLYRPSLHGKIENKVQLEYLSAVPEPPENLNEHGAKFWFDILNQLLQVKGLVMIADLPTFQLMAYKFQVWNECAALLKVQGMWVVDDKGNSRENPVLVTMEKAEKIFISLAREFGCTPSARNNLKAPTQKEEEKDPLSGFEL
jgi:P27 family predicted phage terminase small subunit